ncbi:MAG: NAD(P)H-quinone oxidoreductase subunit L [Leptolyngbya sp. SIO1E4]|nr:NAD(P)H-quinone oxidoreductase subunit L [Leptolyngbya sp. SIO1E4]
MLTDLPLSTDLLITLALYGAIAGAYLLVLPAALLFYLKARWHKVSSLERFFLYGLMFAFFPGMLLLSPFVNFRPQPRSLTP